MALSRRHFIGTALALACLPGSVSARDPAPPADDAPAWLSRWLAAFNDARASRYVQFVRSYVPTLVPYLDDDLGMREASGGFVLLRSERTAPREITAWVRDRRWDRFSRVVLTIGDGRIDDLAFLGASPPADFVVRRTGEREALARLRRKLRTEAAAGRFSGAVLIAKGDDVLFREAYGSRSIHASRDVTPQTRFCIGSAGKMFIAVAILQLVQQGRLRLTDTIATSLPAYPDTPLARTVTIEHLLTHSGGTGDFFGADYDRHQAELRTPSDFVRMFGDRAPAFAPGSRWGYSNFGFIVLGAIVEHVTATPWDVHLERGIFRVAGMASTSSSASDGDTAAPCTGAAETGLRALPFYTGLPAGGGYSTVEDLHRFGVALRDGRLLDGDRLDQLVRPRIAAGTAHWSLGLRVASRNGASWYGHGGAAPGVNADVAIYPQSDYRTVVLSNRGHPHALNVADYIGARLPLNG